MDIRLKDVIKCIKTFQITMITNEDFKESFYPSYGEINTYGDYYVTDIQADNDKLIISITSQI